MRVRLASSLVLAPLALVVLVRCSDFESVPESEDASAPADAAPAPPTADGGVDAAEDASTCKKTAYTTGQKVTAGAVCGVGACRVLLEGDCPKTAVDGGTPTFCNGAFPAEACGTPGDDNCDGVLNEGCLGAAAAVAGTRCFGCAAGERVKRGTDGTISGQNGSYLDRFTTTDCINSTLCGFGEPRWVRHMNGPGITCAQFCQQLGGKCVEECTTTQPPCDPPAASVNQGGKKFGTYTADYQCMQMGPGPAKTSTPNTGSCTFVPTDYGYGPLPDNRFSYNCCCTL